MKIILTTLNAKYPHTSIGLRYLYANLKEFKSYASIQEYTITENINNIVEKLLASSPAIIAVGVYIWNASLVSDLVTIIKQISPETIIILGGPEVSHFPFRTDFDRADYIIQGEGETALYSLYKDLFNNISPEMKIIKSEYADLNKIELPYIYYTDEDIKNRVIYVESSRGCPYSCEYCLSSIDKTVRKFDNDRLLFEINKLWERGVRKFKFVDRSFNINDTHTINSILDFFLKKEPPYLIHFEVVPEHFSNEIKEKLKHFDPAVLQLEVGIQTLNPEVSQTIKRKLNVDKIKQNLVFLNNETNAHLHTDLIVGLPGESIESFGINLDLLTSLVNSEIQIGILKKLSGTSISRHDKEYEMVYSNTPPYEILQNKLIPFELMQKMKRFARFWDLTYNSGNFNKTVRLIWEEMSVFKSFLSFTEWIYTETASTWQISLNRLAELLFKYLTEIYNKDKTIVADIIVRDIQSTTGRTLPAFLREYASHIPDVKNNKILKINKRQSKHFNKSDKSESD